MARCLRTIQGVGTEPLPNDAALAAMLGVDRLPLAPPRAERSSRWLDALVDVNDAGHGGFFATSHRPESRRFAFCRALCEYVIAADTVSALVTVTRSERQTRNWAFAAELLAPSHGCASSVVASCRGWKISRMRPMCWASPARWCAGR